MATKTIALQLDAYEKLRRAKRTPRESFSSVVRRAEFPGQPLTAGQLLERVLARAASGDNLVSEDILNRIDEAQASPRRSDDPWE